MIDYELENCGLASSRQLQFGAGYANRTNEDLGHFCGCGTITPVRVKSRAIVASDGGCYPRRWSLDCTLSGL